LGKYGSINSNLIIGRPFHLTWEIIDKPAEEGGTTLRLVPAAELYEDIRDEDGTPGNTTPAPVEGDGEEIEVVNQEGKVVMRTNREIIDTATSQKLTFDDIEALKKADTTSGKETIARILESHTALGKKTNFSLAKYTLRKRKKYLKRFTVLPLDVAQLSNYFLYDKEPKATMEMREEILSLVMSWSNVHCGGPHLLPQPAPSDSRPVDHNRYLAVDETGGLLVAAMAERMGILYPNEHTYEAGRLNDGLPSEPTATPAHPASTTTEKTSAPIHSDFLPHQSTNTITLIHPAMQPNLALLNYFSHDLSSSASPHPLHTHLKTLSWLQLLHPDEDTSTHEPASLTPSQLSALKSGRRSAYYRKRRRWSKLSSTIAETRAGDFSALVIASYMTPASILNPLLPLLRGGAQVAIYSPTSEPLVELMDYYSNARRGAFVDVLNAAAQEGQDTAAKRRELTPSDEFPVDPTLLLATALHTARATPWQVLPGRTHPKMMGRGGAEGYVFVGTRVLPSEGRVEARGVQKRRKIVRETNGGAAATAVASGLRDGGAEAMQGVETREADEKAV
jgi:tRNA (adenine-N(1)-)-methyltransferase non-catalytic subunit